MTQRIGKTTFPLWQACEQAPRLTCERPKTQIRTEFSAMTKVALANCGMSQLGQSEKYREPHFAC